MEPWEITLLLFSGLGIFNSLAVAFFFLVIVRRRDGKDVFLSLLLMLFVMQILHALLERFTNTGFPCLSNLYLLGSYLQGPVVFLYLQRNRNPNLRIWPWRFLGHAVPYLLLGTLKYNFQSPGPLEWVAVYLVGIQSLAYVILCFFPWRQLRDEYRAGQQERFRAVFLFPAFALLWINYPLSGILGTDYQVWETILHSCFVYYLIFLLVKSPRTRRAKYLFSPVDPDQSRVLFQKVRDEILRQEWFLDPDLTQVKLARKLSLPLNTLSQVINQNSGQNFRDFLNAFRIDKARTLLPEGRRRGFTIASMGFECGFNSLSAFNRAFKKATGLTPTQYLNATN